MVNVTHRDGGIIPMQSRDGGYANLALLQQTNFNNGLQKR